MILRVLISFNCIRFNTLHYILAIRNNRFARKLRNFYPNQRMGSTVNISFHKSSWKYDGWRNFVSDCAFPTNLTFISVVGGASLLSGLQNNAWGFWIGPFRQCVIRSVNGPFIKLFQKFLQNLIFKKSSYHSSSNFFIFFDMFPFPIFSHQFSSSKKALSPFFWRQVARGTLSSGSMPRRRKGPRWRPRRRSKAPKAMAFNAPRKPWKLHLS